MTSQVNRHKEWPMPCHVSVSERKKQNRMKTMLHNLVGNHQFSFQSVNPNTMAANGQQCQSHPDLSPRPLSITHSQRNILHCKKYDLTIDPINNIFLLAASVGTCIQTMFHYFILLHYLQPVYVPRQSQKQSNSVIKV